MVFRIAFGAALVLVCVGSTQAQSPEPQTPLPAVSGSENQPQTDQVDSTVAPVQPEKVSDAEKIARLQRTIEEDGKQIDEIRSRLNDPENEYSKAEADFGEIDGELEEANETVEKLKSAGQPDEAASFESTLSDLQRRRELAKERFDLAIEGRKARQQQLDTLEQKLESAREALRRLTAPVNGESAEPPDSSDAAHPTRPSQESATDGVTPPSSPGSEQTPGAAAPEEGSSTDEEVPVDRDQAPGETDAQAPDDEPPSEELIKAREEASTKETAAEDAEQEARSVTERLEQTRSEIDVVGKRVSTAQQQADNARQTERTLDEELQKKWDEGASREELGDLRGQIGTARERYTEARADVRALSDRLNELHADRGRLQSEQIAALQEAEAKRGEAEQAQEAVESLQNPFTVNNVLQWLLTHGLRVFLAIGGIFLALTVARIIERRLVPVIMRAGVGGSARDRENRAKTLLGVFHNAMRVVVVAGGLLVILAEVGVDIVPLLGGAAVLGLAVAFGAQNLIRDYFYGFMILMENQFTVNDVVKIGDTAGLVERITLRMTVLRDLSGTVHFVPHGNATTVSNMTHGWSRALFEIGVAYKENVDRVMEVLMDLGRELRSDPDFSYFILDDPEMLGLSEFGDSAVVIKFFIKTRPLKQWAVKRELQRRIKNKFDELGIEIPFPHRTLYHVHEGGGPTADA